jgi:hypothetical protein
MSPVDYIITRVGVGVFLRSSYLLPCLFTNQATETSILCNLTDEPLSVSCVGVLLPWFITPGERTYVFYIGHTGLPLPVSP